jgi:hypothetical protein
MSSIECAQNNFWAYCTFGAYREPMLHGDWRYLQIDQNELPLDAHHLVVPSGVSKMIFEPIARSAQTVQQSYVEINTISKRTQMSFHLTHITLEVHRVWPKIFLCSWYIQRKPCTYVVLRLTLSPNRSKRASSRPTSARSSIGCAQNDFWAYCTFGANCELILREDWHYLQMNQSELPFDPHHLGGPSSAAKKYFRAHGKFGTNRAPIWRWY